MLKLLEQCLYRFLVSGLAGERVNGFNPQTCKPANPLNKKGSVLIIALWVLFYLSMLVLAVGAYIRPQLNLAGRLQDRLKTYYLAESGIKKAISIVMTMDEQQPDRYNALNQAWNSSESEFKEIELGEGFFSVVNSNSEIIKYGLIDEERKININKAPYDVLERFFEIAGEMPSNQAADMTNSIIDWRDEDNFTRPGGAENSYYLSLIPSYTCKNKDFQVLEELLLVKGMNPDIFNKIKERITVFGIGAVNINTADKVVLESIGLTDVLAEKIIHFRNGNDGEEATEDDNIFVSLPTIVDVLRQKENLTPQEIVPLSNAIAAGFICTYSDNFKGESIGKLKGKSADSRIIFVFNRNKRIEYWREQNGG